jgi:hypothetical protein
LKHPKTGCTIMCDLNLITGALQRPLGKASLSDIVFHD